MRPKAQLKQELSQISVGKGWERLIISSPSLKGKEVLVTGTPFLNKNKKNHTP